MIPTLTAEILPGPIILLLFLPALPLLLFSLGARPPDTNSLPFSTGDFFVTTACLTTAGAIGLGMAYWPEGLTGLASWVKGEGIPSAGPLTARLGGQPEYPRAGFQSVRGQTHPHHSNRGPSHPRPGRQDMWQTSSPGRQAQAQTRTQEPKALPPIGSRSIAARSAERVSTLRKAFAPWYSPDRPHLGTALLVSLLFLTLLTLSVGHWLRAAYEAEPAKPRAGKSSPSSGSKQPKTAAKDGKPSSSSSSSGWVEREFRKRKEEKGDPQKTIDRVTAETEKERQDRKARQEKMKDKDFEKWRTAEEEKRTKDIEKLRTLLADEGLEPIALPELESNTAEEEPAADAEAAPSAPAAGKTSPTAKLKANWKARWKAAGEAVGRPKA